MGSLDRIDSLDEYFMLNSPPESPIQPNRAVALGGGAGAAAAAAAGFDIYGYYSMSGNNAIASQGNVKQSTSNITVDRSNALGGTPLGGRRSSMNSTFGQRALPSTQRDIDEMLKMDDKEFNLSELFLQSNHRSSLNSTYKAKGALKGHDKELRKTRANSLSSSFFDEEEANNNNTPTSRNSNAQNQQKPSPTEIDRRKSDVSNADEDYDLGVEPTPLSEIRAKQEQRQRFHGPRQQQASNEASQQQRSTSGGLTAQQLQHHTYQQYRQQRLQHSNYYPFGRSYQLPIPTMPPVSPPDQAKNNSQPGSPMLADAVATAAALASVQDSDTNNASSSVPNPIAPKPSNSPHRHRTPPHSPEQSNGRSSASWHGSPRPQSRNSNKSGGTGSPNRQSQLPNRQAQQQSYAQYQQHPAYPPQQQQQQHSHSHHQAHHHPPYHSVATPLAVGGSYPAKPKIVGPYTTAQQEGNNIAGGARRRTSAGGMSTATTVTSNVTAATNSNNQTTAATTSTAAAPAPASTYLPRRGHHMPREASAAHTTPKGALENAANARRGYSGFHKPATSQTTNNYHHPLPTKYANYPSSGITAPAGGPPTTISYPRKSSTDDLQDAAANNNPNQVASATATAATSSAFSSNGAYASLRASAAPSPHPPADTAYERKKQRAKDARVKLNESIERLHVSMGVAGTESKKRVEQLRILMKQAGRSTESTTDHQAFQLMESCVKTAESAKKWDRPNFVGSAATMIECLNSQCEILMKELLEFLQDESRPPSTVPPAEADSEIKNESGVDDACNEKKQYDKEQESELSPNGKRDQRESLAGESSEELSEKRRRLNGAYDDEEDEKKDASSATDGGAANSVSPIASKATIICTPSVGSPMRLEESTMDLIASFLDPLSVVQCLRVCKSWRGESSCFAKAETWTNLCIKRFGVVQVCKWREKENEDDDDEENDVGENVRERRGERSDKMLRLYREMDRNNVMPPLQADSGERILVGETRLQSGVAAWMFLVERSNGETMRSLKRNPDEPSSSRKGGIYTSAPVVELRIVIQNIGGGKTMKRGPHLVIIKNQQLTVDASTRRRGEEFPEISWDDRFRKKLLRLDGSPYVEVNTPSVRSDQLAALDLFESVVLDVFINAKRCSTSSKFLQRSNFLRILVSIDDKTQAVVVPIKAK